MAAAAAEAKTNVGCVQRTCCVIKGGPHQAARLRETAGPKTRRFSCAAPSGTGGGNAAVSEGDLAPEEFD